MAGRPKFRNQRFQMIANIACESCAERADQAQDYVDAVRGAALGLIDPI